MPTKLELTTELASATKKLASKTRRKVVERGMIGKADSTMLAGAVAGVAGSAFVSKWVSEKWPDLNPWFIDIGLAFAGLMMFKGTSRAKRGLAIGIIAGALGMRALDVFESFQTSGLIPAKDVRAMRNTVKNLPRPVRRAMPRRQQVRAAGITPAAAVGIVMV